MMVLLLLHSLFPALTKNEMRRNISCAFFYCLLLKNTLCIIFFSASKKEKFPVLNGLLMQHWTKDIDTLEKLKNMLLNNRYEQNLKPYIIQTSNCLDFKLVNIPFKFCERSVLLSQFCKCANENIVAICKIFTGL